MSKPFSLKKTTRTNLLLTSAATGSTGDLKHAHEADDFATGSATEKIECEKINSTGGGGVRGMVKKIGRKTRITTDKLEQQQHHASVPPASASPSTSATTPAPAAGTSTPASASATIIPIQKRAPSIKHRWLLTRKTWRYMSDAGKRLIPDSIHVGASSASSSAAAPASGASAANKDDLIPKIEEYFQEVCRNEQKFLLWRRKSSYPGAISSLRRKKQLQRRKNNTGANSGGNVKSDPDSADDNNDGSLRWEKQNQQKLQRPNNEYQIIINMLENLLNSDGCGDSAEEGKGGPGMMGSGGGSPSGLDNVQTTATGSRDNNAARTFEQNSNSTNTNRRDKFAAGTDAKPSKSPENRDYSSPSNSSAGLTSAASPAPTGSAAAASEAQRSAVQDLSIWHSSNYDQNADKTNNIYTNILLDSLRQYRKKNYSPYLMSMAHITPDLLNDRPLLRKILRDIKQQQQINKMSANILLRNDSCMSLNLPLNTNTRVSPDDLNFSKWNSKEGLSSSNNLSLSSSGTGTGESMTKLISTKLLNKNREERMKFLTGNSGSSSTNLSSNLSNTTTTTTTSLSYEQQQQIRYYKQQQQQNFIIKNSQDNYLKFNTNNQSSPSTSATNLQSAGNNNSNNSNSNSNTNNSSNKSSSDEKQPPMRVICKQQQQQKLYQHTTTTAIKLKPAKLSAVNISLTTASSVTPLSTATSTTSNTNSGTIIKTTLKNRSSSNSSGSQAQSANASSSTGRGDAGAGAGGDQDYNRPPASRQFGTQTNTIPLSLLQEWLKSYKNHVAEVEKQQADDKFYNQQQAEQQNAGPGDEHPPQTPAHQRRKSSLDNEDISQSVSDTIKRYLRMARKAKPNQEQANRFKRVNYDRNLRNIKAKGEITMPGDDDGNSKGVQTDDNWLIVLFNDLNQLNSVAEMESSSHSSSAQSAASQTHQSILQTGTQFLTNLLWHSSSPTSAASYNNNNANNFDLPEGQASGTQDSASSNITGSSTGPQQVMVVETPIVMQKSKSSSNVGHLVSKKIWKTRSKSQTRATITPSPTLVAASTAAPQQASNVTEVPVKAQWVPQGKGIWKDERQNRCIQLTDTKLTDLTQVEREILQKISLDKISQLNFDFNVKLPVEDYSSASSSTNAPAAQPKPQKRRALLLKRKALTTGFFDNGKGTKDDSSGDNGSGDLSGGLVFGITLQKCIENDLKRLARAKSTSKTVCATQPDKQPRTSRSSLSSLSDKSESLETLNRQTSLSQSNILGRSSDDIVIPFTDPNESSDISSVGDKNERKYNLNIPLIVLICIKYLETNGMNTIGIFRVGTSKKRVRQLRENFDKGLMTIDSQTCPHDVATLLKEFLRDLPEPLLCHTLYVAFIKTQNIRNRRLQLEAISHLIKILPPTHADTLYCLLKFLSNIAEHCDDNLDCDGVEQQGNKMDSSNLATMLAPNILRTSAASPEQESDERLDVINVIRTMIDHYVDLFFIHSYVVDEIYTHMLDTNPKELDSLCDRRLMLLMKKEIDPTAILHNLSLPKKDADEQLQQQQKRRIYSRDEFLHENAAKGGPNISMRRSTGSPSGGDLIRRRRRHNPNDLLEMTIVTSSDGTGLTGKTRSSSIDSNSSISLGFFEPTTPSSASSIVSSSSSPRRQSTPNASGGIVKASLKIPVHTIQTTQQQSQNIGDDILDIPYIEEISGSSGPSMSMLSDYDSLFLQKQNRRQHNKRDDSLNNAITGSLSLITAGNTSTNASISSDHGISTGYDDLVFSSITTSSGTTATSPPSSSSPLSQCSTPDTLRSSSNNSSSCNNTQQFFNLDDMKNLLISIPSSASAASSLLNKDRTGSIQSNRSDVLAPKTTVPSHTAEKTKKSSIKKSAPAMVNPNSSPSQSVSSTAQFKQHQTNINEQKWTPSITNIGGAVLRSKTADFERLLGATAAAGKGTRTGSAGSSSSTSAIPQALTSSVSASSISGGAVAKKTPVYKRQELISSVQQLQTKSKK